MEKLKSMKKLLAFSLVLTMLCSISLHVFATEEESLNEIIENAENGATITLEKDYVENVVISGEKEITLDLNGHTIESTTDTGKDTIKVEYGSELTITGDGKIISQSKNGSCVFNNGTVTIENGRIEKLDKSFYNITNHGILTINGGTVINETEYDGTSHASLVDNGYYSYNSTNERNGHIEGKNAAEPTLTINGGEFNGGLNTIKNDDASILVINDGTFKNNIQVSVLNWNRATINGGTFEVPTGNDKTTICNAKSVGVSYNAGELTVNGGTFNAEYFIESNNAYGDSVKGDTTVITGGTFNTTLGVVRPVRSSGDYSVSISGGTFKVEPEEAYMSESTQKFEKNGEWLVGEKVVLTLIYDNGTEETKEDFLSGDKATLEAPTKDGYTFKGWKAEDGTIYEVNEEEENTIILTSDVTLTAQWEEVVTETESGETSGDIGSGEISGDTSGDTSGDVSSDNSGDTSGEQSGDMNSGDDNSESSGSSGSSSYSISIVKETENGTIELSKTHASKGSKVTLTVSAKEGYELEKILVKDKNEEEIILTKNDDGTYSFEMPASKVLVEASFKIKVSFKDIKSDDWYYEAVKALVEKGAIKGISEDEFAPEEKLTRGMLVTMIHRLEKEAKASKKATFKDVDEKAYYADAVNWAYENKIIMGYSEETFGAEDSITREQVALILYRYAKYLDEKIETKDVELKFEDSKEISDYAKEAINWAVESKIMLGRSEKVLAPKGIATRAEASVLLIRLENIGK